MGGPADLFFVLFVAKCWRGGILWAQLRKDREMTNDQLQQFADGLIKQYRHEIVRDGDWWHGTDEYSFNIHCPDDDGWFRINVYKVDPVTGMDNYDHWIDLAPVHLGDAE